MMKKDIDQSIQQLKSRLTVWCVLVVVLQIITIFEPLPFIRRVAWLATAYCVILLFILSYLLIIKYTQ